MKKKIYLLYIIGLIVLCCGCGKETQKESNNMEIESEDETLKKPDEEKMLDDLKEKQGNIITFLDNKQKITIPIVSMTIDRAKEEDGLYIAYCTLELKNDYYDAKVTYSLIYGYYDIGGWQIDEVKEESRNITPLKPDDTIVLEYIKSIRITDELYDVTGLKMVDYEAVNGEEHTWKCNFNEVFLRKYANICYMDSIECHFDSENGWDFGKINTSYSSADMSKLTEKRFYGEYSGFTVNIEIIEFDEELKKATVNFMVNSPEGYYLVKGSKGKIYSLTGTSTGNINTYNIFKEENNVSKVYYTHFEYSGGENVYLSFDVDWDVDNGMYIVNSNLAKVNIKLKEVE